MKFSREMIQSVRYLTIEAAQSGRIRNVMVSGLPGGSSGVMKITVNRGAQELDRRSLRRKQMVIQKSPQSMQIFTVFTGSIVQTVQYFIKIL